MLSKVFELVLMNDLQCYLQSDELQFGFKRTLVVHMLFLHCVQLLITIASLAQLLLFVRLISQRPLIVLITISY